MRYGLLVILINAKHIFYFCFEVVRYGLLVILINAKHEEQALVSFA